jgi:hypothetical protein
MFSASQVETFLSCQRKWAWRSIEKVSTPPHPSAQLGLEVHKEIEHHYRFGRPFDLARMPGRIAMSGYHLMPPQAGTYDVEKHFRVQIGRHHFQGYIDLWWPGNVRDWKTTSNLKYAKTDLCSDVQGAIYAYADGSPVVRLEWVYMQTKGKRGATVTVADATLEKISPTLRRIESAADEMQGHIDGKRRALDLLPNVDHCDAFGGCPYQARCFGDGPMTTPTTPGYMASMAGLINPPAAAAATPQIAPGAPMGGGYWMGYDGIPTNVQPVPPQAPPAPTPVEATPAPTPVAEASAPAKRGRPKKDGATAAGDEPTDEEIGRVVRFLVGR